MKTMESYLFKDGYQIGSLNSDRECAENHSECDESIDDDNLSFDYEEKDSRFSVSNDCNWHEKDAHVTKNESHDNMYESEEAFNNSRDNTFMTFLLVW